MSWQNYVDQQLVGSGHIVKAVIAGHDGTLWAKSNNIEPSKDELVKLSTSFGEQSNLAMSGVHMGGEKYIYLSGTDNVIRCKKAKAGMHCGFYCRKSRGLLNLLVLLSDSGASEYHLIFTWKFVAVDDM
ncbi:hypothetical protein Pmani_011963 [Petrolisthes manimaculis]|uniref:Profilin n=1 Tax=Petrolisthes manimaculis TaxID=1843537 RepID=A0AAE1PD49_9EUCA|nr:hypothetical protein Pmani_022871 [Petrolisthes manimaculis]KAK4316936.1 hypothetical protein Pmani_011963 [Petrolisthes manimaculis]